MPALNVALSDHQEEVVESLVQSARHQNASEVLKQAARQGWADVSSGRYDDVADDQLEQFIGQLGRRAGQRAKTAN